MAVFEHLLSGLRVRMAVPRFIYSHVYVGANRDSSNMDDVDDGEDASMASSSGRNSGAISPQDSRRSFLDGRLTVHG
jgi:hypothetical protein